MSSYELKCTNLIERNGRMVKCSMPARLCECSDGFNEHESASVRPRRDLAYCLCGNLAVGKPEWTANGANPVCNYCRNQPWKNLADAVGARYIGSQLRSGMIPDPWWWLEKAATDAAWHVVRMFGGYWVKMELPIAEPLPKMPNKFVYRVGHDAPLMPGIEEIQPADPIQVAGNWSKRDSRPIHNG